MTVLQHVARRRGGDPAVSAVSKFSSDISGKSPRAAEPGRRPRFPEFSPWSPRASRGPISSQIVCALRFFYGVTLGEGSRPEERIPSAREAARAGCRSRSAPTRSCDFLEAVSSPREPGGVDHGLCGPGSGSWRVAGREWRISTATRSKVLIRHGKGAKDRNVMLSCTIVMQHLRA